MCSNVSPKLSHLTKNFLRFKALRQSLDSRGPEKAKSLQTPGKFTKSTYSLLHDSTNTIPQLHPSLQHIPLQSKQPQKCTITKLTIPKVITECSADLVPIPASVRRGRIGNGFVSTSHDETLLETALSMPRIQFLSSTSTMTSLYSHLHLLQTDFGGINTKFFPEKVMQTAPSSFVRRMHGSEQFILRRTSRGGRDVWVIDKMRTSEANNQVLINVGNLLEETLTQPAVTPSKSGGYSFMSNDALLVRSQLDCVHPGLKGRSVFDMKTRATQRIRWNMDNFSEDRMGCEEFEGFPSYIHYELERLDMARGPLMKYYYQVLLGDMDGVFVVYHNIEKVIGFEYINRNVMRQMLGITQHSGHRIFNFSSYFINEILKLVTCEFSDSQQLMFHFGASVELNTIEIFVECLDHRNKIDTEGIHPLLKTLRSDLAVMNLEQLREAARALAIDEDIVENAKKPQLATVLDAYVMDTYTDVMNWDLESATASVLENKIAHYRLEIVGKEVSVDNMQVPSIKAAVAAEGPLNYNLSRVNSTSPYCAARVYQNVLRSISK